MSISAKPSLDTVKRMLASVNLPDRDLTDDHCEHFFFAGDEARPQGIVGIELLGDAGLLRSLAVRDESRGAGLGSVLVSHIEEYARSRGVRTVYLLTTTAERFFAARGYQRCGRERAPDSVRSTREFSDLCPANSTFMAKPL